MDKEKNMNNVKRKKENPILIVVLSIIGVLLVGYVVMLLFVTGSLSNFGQPFRIDGNRVVFGPSSCASTEHLDCYTDYINHDGNFTECSCEAGASHAVPEKPIIYLYPESELYLKVKLGNLSILTSSYPKYVDGWDITAYPNGDLIDMTTGNRLYALFWEGRKPASGLDKTVGFMVKSDDVVEFLEEKLDLLGLNYREKEEFIVYWLPKLETNRYNYIYFATEEEIEEEMPLEFSIQPDTVIRVRMIFEGLDEASEVEEQILEPAPERKGFTVVEWGGIKL